MKRTDLNGFRGFSGAAALLALGLGLVFEPAPALARANNGEIAGLCAAAAAVRERQSRIPKNLLRAISTVETGRWDETARASFAWPWTVTAKGKGRYLPTKDAAIRTVRALQREGVTNIDVGCMQINLGYHADAFQTLEEAFEPATNVAYAAKFLTELRKTRRSWTRAVQFYHSSDPRRQRYYGGKVEAARRMINAAGRTAQTAASPPPDRAAQSTGPRYSPGLSWPPRGYRAQRRMELAARAWAFRGRRR